MSSQLQMSVARLRILETTDLHMHLLGYDYFADRHDDSLGLCGLADLIDVLRAECDGATLLCDIGDFLEGNPLANLVAAELSPDDVHPMIAAMNDLGYDAMTLGNHDFDYGLSFLRSTLHHAKAAVVSANVRCADGLALADNFKILHRTVRCDDGSLRDLKIGVTGFAPPKVSGATDGHICIADIVTSAKHIVPLMKDAGADLVVALCHSGIGNAQHSPSMENAAIPLAAVDGIDVVLLGHTHEQFPDPHQPIVDAVDPQAGTLHGKPAMMSGYYGTSLGVLDLDLAWGLQGWSVQSHASRLIKPASCAAPQTGRRRKLEGLAAPAHAATLASMRKPIAQTTVHIQNYMATIQPDLGLQLLAQVMRDAVPEDLKDAPVLAAVSPFRYGGRNGSGHYIDIPPGELTLRDAAAIFPFADRLCAVQRTGAQIKDWLERTAAHYNTIAPDQAHQDLLNPRSAGYNCDALYGLNYTFDLSKDARFDLSGERLQVPSGRVSSVTLNGRPICDTDLFVVATKGFRANGGGGFACVPPDERLWTSPDKLRDILVRTLRQKPVITDRLEPVWAFDPIKGALAQFRSSPKAQAHLGGAITHQSTADGGFATYNIAF